jgi:hypothetical protein
MKKLSVRLAAALTGLSLLFAVPAAAEADWGAIAVDPISGHTGVSYEYGSAQGAQRRARAECKTSHCKVAIWVRNGWGALVEKHNGVYVAGIGTTKHAAFAKARQRAHQSSARSAAYVFSGY